jgi:hypothetical protein
MNPIQGTHKKVVTAIPKMGNAEYSKVNDQNTNWRIYLESNED